MSRIQDALRRAQGIGQRRRTEPDRPRRRTRVLCVTSNKGGVGKTTVATNLAVHVRALWENLPILVLGLDDQSAIDRMFALDGEVRGPTMATVLRTRRLGAAIQMGQFGIHFVPASPHVSELKQEVADPFLLQSLLKATDWPGLVIVDTKSDLEILSQNALAASDLALVLVADRPSLLEAERVFSLLDRWKVPRERARILLSLVDRRVKYRDPDTADVLALLISEIRRRGLPLCQSFLSRSPKVESLATNPEGRLLPVVSGAPGSHVSLQLRHLAEDVLDVLFPEGVPAETLDDVEEGAPEVLLEGLTAEATRSLPANPFAIEAFPFRIGRLDAGTSNDLSVIDSKPWQVSRAHATLVEQSGRVGVVDSGSRLGSYVDGRALGGSRGAAGPLFFEGREGRLVLGNRHSPFRFRVLIRRRGEPALEPERSARQSVGAALEQLQLVAGLAPLRRALGV
ncbi:MAG: AAA family ATPase [Myxococcota bacterium]|nr:AAA family ATPase [Myxococcota bacterium]